jgi:hypothetical protein
LEQGRQHLLSIAVFRRARERQLGSSDPGVGPRIEIFRNLCLASRMSKRLHDGHATRGDNIVPRRRSHGRISEASDAGYGPRIVHDAVHHGQARHPALEFPISNGFVSHPNLVKFRGRVTTNGLVHASVTVQDKYAVGAGKLTKTSGQGIWKGRSGSARCSGYWTAQRGQQPRIIVWETGLIEHQIPTYYRFSPSFKAA